MKPAKLLGSAPRFVIWAVAFGFFSCAQGPPQPVAPTWQRMEWQCSLVLEALPSPADGPIELRLAVPVDDGHQQVELLERPVAAEFLPLDEFGNRFSLVRLDPIQDQDGDWSWPDTGPWLWRYRLLRTPDLGGRDGGVRRPDSDSEGAFPAGYLMPSAESDRLNALARKHRGPSTDAFAVARSLYDFVLEDVDLGQHGRGWGRGDAEWVSLEHYGTAVDFAAYFVALCRRAGVPARLLAGYRGMDESCALHAWAQFWVPVFGWVAVDPAAADSRPELEERCFGRLPADRVLLWIEPAAGQGGQLSGQDRPFALASAVQKQDLLPLKIHVQLSHRP